MMNRDSGLLFWATLYSYRPKLQNTVLSVVLVFQIHFIDKNVLWKMLPTVVSKLGTFSISDQ